jgi:UDP:flavonoid glycosyltransferase YjiC (YdhE family)
MKILISTLGSRGDTQPYLALAVGLQQAGHRVTLVSPQGFIEWIQSYGVNAHPVRFNPQEVMQTISKSKNPFQAIRAMREVMNTGVMEAMNDCWQAAQDTDFLVQTGTGNGALEIASTRDIPVAFAYLVPMPPTRAFPMFMLPFRFSLGAGYNYFTHTLVQRALWSGMGGPTVNRWRARLNLPAWRSEAAMHDYARSLATPSLYGYSPSVIPKPPDWGDEHHVTGYWFLDAPPNWQPPADLLQFLESGPPPVYVGFGSMSHQNPERQARLALRALELSGQRGILLTGWGGLTRLSAPPNVFFVDDVPHAWLFPRMVAVVHHGGAGTTGAGLRAGVPNIITPFGGDQVAWADHVVKLGVGLQATAAQRLTAEKLASAIHAAVNDSALRARAVALGEKVRAEDGVARAVEVIERHAADFHQRVRQKP